MAFPTNLSNVIDYVSDVTAALWNALETKVGITGSTDPNSLDYRIAKLEVQDNKGTTVSSSGTNSVSITAALSGKTFIQGGTATNTYALPTGDLSSYIATVSIPLTYRFIKQNANTLTIDPGTGNFIGPGGAGDKLYLNNATDLNNSVVLQLTASVGSVNIWTIMELSADAEVGP